MLKKPKPIRMITRRPQIGLGSARRKLVEMVRSNCSTAKPAAGDAPAKDVCVAQTCGKEQV